MCRATGRDPTRGTSSNGSRPSRSTELVAFTPTQAKGVFMLEVDQDTLEKLLAENADFKSMYDRHAELNKKVDKAGRGELPLSNQTLSEMKKEKLVLKDRMTEIIHRSG
jgi:uncharacterized protein